MKKWKGNLLQRMMVVLLTAVLVIGMAAGTAPTEVRAEEPITTLVLKVTVKGYTGSDGSILGDVKLESELRIWTKIPTVSVENGVITYTVKEVPTPNNWRWLVNEISLFGEDLVHAESGQTVEKTATFCTVNFKDGNDIINSQYVKQGNTVTTPVPPQKEGYTFSGWVTEDGGNTEFDFTQGIQDVTDVYASWTQNHTHIFSNEWSYNNSDHWHAATCGHTDEKSDKAAHNFGDWTVTKSATESEDGSKERSCACGYKETVVIPKTGAGSTDAGTTEPGTGSTDAGTMEPGTGSTDAGTMEPGTGSTDTGTTAAGTGASDSATAEPGTDSTNSGKIETDKEQGANTPATELITLGNDLIRAVLTQEEKNLVDAGTDIKITLDIDNIDASVDPADKQAVTDTAGIYSVGQYLDINLYKIIGADKKKISQTNEKIRIGLTIPDSLKNTDNGKQRSYAVVRVHEGVAELLADTDNDEATITIETDLFSTYAIVYRDAEKDHEPKTKDTTPVEICATLTMISGLSYLLLFFGGRKKGMTEQEKKELTASIIAWARKGRKLRKAAAIVALFLILFYYHSIGKHIGLEWKQAYGE